MDAERSTPRHPSTALELDAGLRRRIALDRALRWEFWPAWLFYLPIIAWILWLGVRFRRWTVFTAANPMMDSGGVVGERKAPALSALMASQPQSVAEFVLLDETDLQRRLSRAHQHLAQLGAYPVVLKPDVGQRGRGVSVVRSDVELEAYLTQASGAVLMQRYIGGSEFGVFVFRDPVSGRGQLYSITRKSFPTVVGDGRRTLAQLILADSRARLIATLLWQRLGARLADVPDAGTPVQLVEIGAHCRGALFTDASALASDALRAWVAKLFEDLPDYGIGRLDLRCPNDEALQQARDLQILEINGVTAEAAHIYQPGYSLRNAYRSLFWQWTQAFRIGERFAAAGAEVTAPLDLLQRFRQDLARGKHWH